MQGLGGAVWCDGAELGGLARFTAVFGGVVPPCGPHAAEDRCVQQRTMFRWVLIWLRRCLVVASACRPMHRPSSIYLQLRELHASSLRPMTISEADSFDPRVR